LFYCARTKINEEIRSRIEVLINQKPDWDYLIKSAIHHKVVPLLYSSIWRTHSTSIPEKFLKELQYYHIENLKKNLFLTVELIKLVNFLEAHQIPVIPYKGPVIAILAYGNISLRQFSDLDILVHPRDYRKTRHLLLEKGYRLATDYSWECSLVNDRYGVCVDLHQSITPEQFPVHFDFKSIQQRLKTISISTGKITTFCPEDMLIVLCVQLAKDVWGHQHNPLRLSKICDIAELIQANHNLNWKQIFNEAKKLGCQRILWAGLFIANKLLDTPIPKPLSRSRNHPSSDFLETLTSDIYNKLVSRSITIDHAEPLSMESFHFKMRERWRDKLYPQYHDLKLRLLPNERDHKFVSLPKSLNALYYLIRPIRLMRDYINFIRSRLHQFYPLYIKEKTPYKEKWH